MTTPDTIFNLIQQAIERRDEARENDNERVALLAQSDVDELSRDLSYKLTLGALRDRDRVRRRSEAN